jgi:opacity protein-like surface antigen
MKKILIAILAISFSSLVFASGDMFAKPLNYFDGLYVGIGAGVNYTTADASANSLNEFSFFSVDPIQVEDVLSAPRNLNSDLGQPNAAGEIFVGYGRTTSIKSDHNNFYLGVELFGKYTPISMDSSVNGSVTSELPTQLVSVGGSSISEELSNNYSVGGDLRIGYMFTPKTMVYILAGIEAGDFDYNVDSSISYSTASNPDLVHSSHFSDEASQLKFGFMPGVGIETMISDNFSLRAQYAYTFFGDVAFNNSNHRDFKLDREAGGVILLHNTTSGEAENISR